MAYPDPDNLMTFLPTSDITPIALGNDDCWVKISSDGSADTYEVHGRYLRNQAGDPNHGVTGTIRGVVEAYVKALGISLKLTTGETQVINGVGYFIPKPGSIHGTLASAWSGLSVAQLYLVGIEFEDEGGRAVEITFTFKKQTTLASQTPATFNPTGADPAFNLGTGNGFIVIAQNPQFVTYRYFGSYVASARSSAETYAAGLANSLQPRELVLIETPTGPQYTPHTNAIKGDLVNPVTSATFADVYCTEVSHDDNGSNTYSLAITFKKSLYTPVTTPATDARVAKYKTVAIGNLPCTIIEDPSDPNFRVFHVKAQYQGSDAAIYGNTLADAIGYEPIFKIPMPRGSAGNRGVIKSYSGVSGTLDCDALLASDVTNLYVESIRTSQQDVGLINIDITLVKPR